MLGNKHGTRLIAEDVDVPMMEGQSVMRLHNLAKLQCHGLVVKRVVFLEG